ncbi:hypothetical protein ACTXT7_003857 [Hymenolepis weldensis]
MREEIRWRKKANHPVLRARCQCAPHGLTRHSDVAYESFLPGSAGILPGKRLELEFLLTCPFYYLALDTVTSFPVISQPSPFSHNFVTPIYWTKKSAREKLKPVFIIKGAPPSNLT